MERTAVDAECEKLNYCRLLLDFLGFFVHVFVCRILTKMVIYGRIGANRGCAIKYLAKQPKGCDAKL